MLLLTDKLPSVEAGKNNQNVLASLGVQYSHRNDEILRPNRIQEERVKKEAATKKARKSRSAEEEEAKPSWPPVRIRRVRDPEKQLWARRKCLVELQLIPDDTLESVADWAKQFIAAPAEEQHKILQVLDDHASKKGLS